jgi:signal transduction histidine kinase
MRDPMRTGEVGTWRESVLRGVLTLIAVIAVPISLVTVLGRSGRDWVAALVVVAIVGVVLPLLRLAPGLSVSVRAGGAIATIFALSIFLLARIGFVPGLSLSLTTTAVLGSIYLGRRFALALILLGCLGFILVGALVTTSGVQLAAADLDPNRMRNWVRIGLTTTLLSTLLTMTIDFVIRHVEAGSRATSEALRRLQTEEAQRSRLEDEREAARRRWQRGAEELIALGRGTAIESGDSIAAFRALCEAGTRGLEVERCSLWLFDEAGSLLQCENLYERTPARHTHGMSIPAARAPRYFAALRAARSFAVADARSDPLTAELGSYFDENRISSLLDAPIRYGDRLVGVVCHEHVGAPMMWSPEAESFAASIADFAARALAAADRATKAVDLRLAFEQLGALHGRVEDAKENERRFLAHELHDELGQMLTVLKLRIQLGGKSPPGEALALVDDLIARVRKMSVDLRPPLLDEVGLVPAVRAYLESQSAVSGIVMSLTAEGTGNGAGARLPAELEIACFRVVQESVTNVIRHASARRIEVRIIRRHDSIALSIRDDGRGFEAAPTLETAAHTGHLGVIGMRERVRGRGGSFDIDSRPGLGTTVAIEIPVAT